MSIAYIHYAYVPNYVPKLLGHTHTLLPVPKPFHCSNLIISGLLRDKFINCYSCQLTSKYQSLYLLISAALTPHQKRFFLQQMEAVAENHSR